MSYEILAQWRKAWYRERGDWKGTALVRKQKTVHKANSQSKRDTMLTARQQCTRLWRVETPCTYAFSSGCLRLHCSAHSASETRTSISLVLLFSVFSRFGCPGNVEMRVVIFISDAGITPGTISGVRLPSCVCRTLFDQNSN